MSIYLNLFFVFAHSVLAVRSLLATVECTRMHIFMCLFFMNFVCLLVYVCTSSPSATVRPHLPHSAMRFYFNVFSAADICIHSCPFIVHVRFTPPLRARLSTPIDGCFFDLPRLCVVASLFNVCVSICIQHICVFLT